MTRPGTTTSPTTFVWDASALHHAAKADNLDVLGSYVSGPRGEPWTHHVTDVVADELARYGLDVPEWTDLVGLDTIELVTAYVSWSSVLSSGSYGHGESSTATWAAAYGAVAIVDDEKAKVVMRHGGVRAHGSAWLLSRAVELDLVDVTSVSSFFDASSDAGQWLPFGRFGYPKWAVKHSLISPSRI